MFSVKPGGFSLHLNILLNLYEDWTLIGLFSGLGTGTCGVAVVILTFKHVTASAWKIDRETLHLIIVRPLNTHLYTCPSIAEAVSRQRCRSLQLSLVGKGNTLASSTKIL